MLHIFCALPNQKKITTWLQIDRAHAKLGRSYTEIVSAFHLFVPQKSHARVLGAHTCVTFTMHQKREQNKFEEDTCVWEAFWFWLIRCSWLDKKAEPNRIYRVHFFHVESVLSSYDPMQTWLRTNSLNQTKRRILMIDLYLNFSSCRIKNNSVLVLSIECFFKFFFMAD